MQTALETLRTDAESAGDEQAACLLTLITLITLIGALPQDDGASPPELPYTLDDAMARLEQLEAENRRLMHTVCVLRGVQS